MARGAAPELVMKLILGRGLRLALLGTVLGLAAAMGLARLMTSLLFGVAILLLGVAMAACYLPARWATRVDPMVALRHE